MLVFPQPVVFEWDRGNSNKNQIKHGVTNEECEEVFFDDEKRILQDVLHSGKEERYIIIGRTRKQRLLFVVCSMRGKKFRIISARDLNKREKHLYES